MLPQKKRGKGTADNDESQENRREKKVKKKRQMILPLFLIAIRKRLKPLLL
jgi:cell division protein FtsB